MGLSRSQLRQVLRRLAREPIFAVVTVTTLALGVGANTVIFGVIERILLRPLPYPQPQQLVYVGHTAPGIGFLQAPCAPSNYLVYREQSRTFQDIGLYANDSVSITGMAEPEQVRAMLVTDAVLPMLGAQPAVGRSFTQEDGKPNGSQTVMLAYGYWQRTFGGSRSVVGQTIKVDGTQREIIGVTPPHFHLLDEQDPAVLLPLQFDRNKVSLGNFSYDAIARLKPGITIEAASADVARMLPMVTQSFPPPEGFSIKLFEDARFGPNVRSLKNYVVGDIGNVLWILMGSIGMLLLIVCANVANLVLVRVSARRQELAVKAALGARGSRIASELLLESLVLGLMGGGIGLGLADGTLRVLAAVAPKGLPRIHEIGIDGSVLLFTLTLSILSSLLVGCVPILKYAGSRLSAGLREAGRAHSQSREQLRARNILVVFQVALALVLLICSGLMMRTFLALTRVDVGFTSPEHVQTFRVAIPENDAKGPEQVARMDEQILQRLATIPGVSAVGATRSLPMAGNNYHDPIVSEDSSYKPGELPPLRRFEFITPGYFRTLGTPLVAGRDFTWNDIYNRTDVALVSESLARQQWQTPSKALGKRIRVATTDDWREIIGVVADVHDRGVTRDPELTVYWPFRMGGFGGQKDIVRRSLAFALRSSRAGTESLIRDVHRAVWAADPNLPPAEVRTLEYFYRNSMARTSFTLMMLAVAGVMALLLGVVGIYGVVSYSVSQRTREIGIRMALGAQRQELTSMFIRHGMVLTAIGVACGLGTAIAAMRLVESLLFHVSPVDFATYVAVSFGLIVTALLASYLPARRAAVVDPIVVLRSE